MILVIVVFIFHIHTLKHTNTHIHKLKNTHLCKMLLFSAPQGDWVWLKKCPDSTTTSVESNAESSFIKVSKQWDYTEFIITINMIDNYDLVSDHCRLLLVPVFSGHHWIQATQYQAKTADHK